MSMEQYAVVAFTTLIAGMPVTITSNSRINFYNFDRMLFQLLSLKEKENIKQGHLKSKEIPY